MIPTHSLEVKNKESVRIVKLDHLTKYDITKPHRHDYFELFVFEQGAGTHDIDFITFPIESNQIHLVSSGRVHKVRRELNTSGYVILFDLSLFESNSALSNFLFDHVCYDVEEFSPTYSLNADANNKIVEITKSIWSDYNSDNSLKDEFIYSNLSLILINCLRSMQREEATLSKNQEVYIQFRKLLRTNFRKIRKVREYSELLNTTEKRLNQIIKAKTGISTSALIYKQVILEAKRLLNTGLSSKAVAYDLNFDDPGHFSKFFKSKTGISPSAFQKIHF